VTFQIYAIGHVSWLCQQSRSGIPSVTKPAISLLAHFGSLKALHRLGEGLGWLCGGRGTPSLFTHQFQAKPCRRSRGVASIIERIDLGCASNLMRVLTNVTAPSQAINKSHHFPET
jgi:hypothetical protein